MAFHHIQYLFVLLVSTFLTIHSHEELTPDFYNEVCPQALPIIHSIVLQKLNMKPRMGAHLLRLHFHDCFVNVKYHIHIHLHTIIHRTILHVYDCKTITIGL